MKRAGCCSGSNPSRVPRHRTIADRLGTRKRAIPTDSGQSAAHSAIRGAPLVVHIPGETNSRRASSDFSFANQDLPLNCRHLSHEVLEQLSFFDPLGHLLAEIGWNMQSFCPTALFPSEQSRLMNRPFPRTPALRIAAPLLTDGKRCLNKRFYLSNACQDALPTFIGQCWSRHMASIYTYQLMSI